MLNAGFTVGAVLAPALVAASLRYGGGRWAFDVVGAVALLLGTCLGRLPHVTLPLGKSDDDDDGAAAADDDAGWKTPPPRLLRGYHEGVARRELSAKAAFESRFLAAMCVVLCCITGCEHGMATWLSPYGIENGALSEARMAFMSSIYWGVMCAGRVLWAFMSGWVTSTWPMLFFDVACVLGSAALLLLCSVLPSAFEMLLWISAMGLGLGVSSVVPCVYSLPPEARVTMTPWAIALLNAASTVGETSFPYVIGLAFESKRYAVLGGLMSGCSLLTLLVSLGAHRSASLYALRRRFDFVQEFEI